MRAFEYVMARTVAGALEGLAVAGAKVKGGGIDLVDQLKERTIAPPRLVGVDRAEGLAGISFAGGALVIGAATKLAALAEHPEVAARFPALLAAVAHAATPQVRAMATVAGNLLQRPRCWYFRSAAHPCPKRGDAVPCPARPGRHEHGAIFANGACCAVHPSNLAVPLLALGAELDVERTTGRRVVAFDALFVGPDTDIRREHVLADDDVVTAVRIRWRDGLASGYAECRHKQSSDWPIATCAVAGARRPDGGLDAPRIVLGAVAGAPLRAEAAEKLLAGKRIDGALIEAVAAAAVAGATPLERNRYKLAICRSVVAEAVQSLAPL